MRSFSLLTLLCCVFWVATFFAILRQTVFWDGLTIAIPLAITLGGLLGAIRTAHPAVRIRAFFASAGVTLGVCISGLLAGVATDFALAVRDFGGGRVEFTKLSGASAKRRLRGAWPAGIESKSVKSVSYANEWTMDSHSVWWRVVTTPSQAVHFQQAIHQRETERLQELSEDPTRRVESVRRELPGPVVHDLPFAKAPAWWSPPTRVCDATEAMLWYKNSDIGTGRGTYTTYDAESNVLWIYEFACQHLELWPRGSVPPGK